MQSFGAFSAASSAGPACPPTPLNDVTRRLIRSVLEGMNDVFMETGFIFNYTEGELNVPILDLNFQPAFLGTLVQNEESHDTVHLFVKTLDNTQILIVATCQNRYTVPSQVHRFRNTFLRLVEVVKEMQKEAEAMSNVTTEKAMEDISNDFSGLRMLCDIALSQVQNFQIPLSHENKECIQRFYEHSQRAFNSSGFTVKCSEDLSVITFDKPDLPNCLRVRNVQDILIPSRVFHHFIDSNDQEVGRTSTDFSQPFHWAFEGFISAVGDGILRGMQAQQEALEVESLGFGNLSMMD